MVAYRGTTIDALIKALRALGVEGCDVADVLGFVPDDEIASIRAELEAMKAERDQKAWLDEVSKETGVSADLIRGATKEEMKAHAEAIAKAYKKPSAPSGQSDTRKGGDGNGPKMTKQEILAIKNSKERKAAIAENIDLFK